MEHRTAACKLLVGLIGHLVEMIQTSFRIAVELRLKPFSIEGQKKHYKKKKRIFKFASSGKFTLRYIANLDDVSDPLPLLFDPQTSGGLLAAIQQHKPVPVKTPSKLGKFTKVALSAVYH